MSLNERLGNKIFAMECYVEILGGKLFRLGYHEEPNIAAIKMLIEQMKEIKSDLAKMEDN